MFSCCCSNDSYSVNARLITPQQTLQQNKPSSEAERLFRTAMQDIQNNNRLSALENFMAAYKAGHPKAAAELINLSYEFGMYYKEIYDFKEAYDMFDIAAGGLVSPEVDGDPRAQVEYGMCYLLGHGVEKNKDQAKVWFTHAAKKGHHLAPQLLHILNSDPSQEVTVHIGEVGVTIEGVPAKKV